MGTVVHPVLLPGSLYWLLLSSLGVWRFTRAPWQCARDKEAGVLRRMSVRKIEVARSLARLRYCTPHGSSERRAGANAGSFYAAGDLGDVFSLVFAAEFRGHGHLLGM